MHAKARHLLYLAFLLALLPACQPAITAQVSPGLTRTQVTTIATAVPATATVRTTHNTPAPPATPTTVPTSTATATPRPTDTPTPTLTPTPIGPCAQRLPADDLLTIVTLEYGLSRDYAPADPVPLADYLPPDVTLGYPTEVRRIIVEPLARLIDDMKADGLQPTIISGYRSYAAQAIAWNKWLQKEPERAAIISAPPGYSEHQLGTTIDFGSPELPELVNQEGIEFHTYFYMTGEGMWLAENAHKYGFTLSYPREAFELTGFYYEPWHYRYVGVELATQLHDSDMFLTEYQFMTQPEPCLPDR